MDNLGVKVYFANEAAKVLGITATELSTILRFLKMPKVGGSFRVTDNDIARIQKMEKEYSYE